MEHGPVDLLVIALGEPKFDGSVLAELQKLASAGINSRVNCDSFEHSRYKDLSRYSFRAAALLSFSSFDPKRSTRSPSRAISRRRSTSGLPSSSL